MKRALLSSGLMAIIAGLGGSLLAADDTPVVQPAHPEHKSSINVAEQATDPSAILTQMGFFYWTTIPESREGDGETFLFQPVLPLSKSNVLRPGLALVASPEPNRVTGMGDLFVLDAFFFHTPNATFGVGPVASFPTATKDELGTGQYSVGADFLFIYKGIKKNISGILLYTQTSVAGDDDRPDVNTRHDRRLS
jgi:hypothetical protein